MELQMKVAQAVHVLNHDAESCNRVAANQWLVQFQQTEAAWEVATSILTSDHQHFPSDYEVEFFAAQILKRKIQNEGYYLQLGVKDALLNALLVAAKRFGSGPPQLLTQICLALSALTLRSVEHGKPIEQLFYSLQNLRTQNDGIVAVLEMLTVLPEEIVDTQTTDCQISSSHRNQYGQELLSHTPMVIEFLLQLSENKFEGGMQPNERNRKVLRCLLSWVRAGCFSEIPEVSFSTHPLLNFVFNSLQVSSSFDLAIEVLVELVSRHEGLPQVLLCRVPFLKEMLLLPTLTGGDVKVIAGLACLMSEIGQAAPSLIVEAGAEARALTDALLSCVAFPCEDWDIADSTLQFWSGLASYILNLDVGDTNKKNVEGLFFSVFSALLDALLLRAQVDESTFNDESGTFDFPDGLVQFRMDLVELLVDICQLLQPSTFVQKLNELKEATRNFHEEIGRGGGGTVYKGTLSDGRVIAVKRLNDSNQGEAEFLAEVNTIGKLNHMNLIEMWGFCAEKKHRLLVYEYMEHGSLADMLSSASNELDWQKKYAIALGTARGLAYLHDECLEWVLHCDVKPQNILLDAAYNPKVSDFGLSKLLDRSKLYNSSFSKIRGTRGYMAPEWVFNQPITSKVDVYSYGIVVLEMVSGQSSIRGVQFVDRADEVEMQNRSGSRINERENASNPVESWTGEIVLEGNYDKQKMDMLVLVALDCVQEDRDARPTMTQVVERLLGSSQ